MNDRNRTYQYLAIVVVLAALVGTVLAIALGYAAPWPEVWWLILVLLTLVCAGLVLWPLEKGPSDHDREAMLERIRKGWLDGVLEQSLYNTARLEPALETSPDSVAPWNADAPAGEEPHPLPAGTSIQTVFEGAGASLAILGEAGSGKTTLLLELARDLAQEAETDSTRPIPAVFNLSSWANHHPPLEQWLICELTHRYHVPKQTACAWVECDQIAPVLDGLDEVPEGDREACVEAINAFAKRHETAPIAVCCGSDEYERLSTRLAVNQAVVIQPLTREQVWEYLDQAGDELAGVRGALEADDALGELVRTPLMLWMLSSAYRDCPAEHVRISGTAEEQQEELFTAYVNAMFRRQEESKAELPYRKEQTFRWLRWLASAMKNQNQTALFLEDLKARWLPGAAGYTVTLALLYGLLWAVFAVGVGVIAGPWRGVTGAVLYGLLGALLYGLFGIEHRRENVTVSAQAWPNEGVWRSALNAVRVALPAGVGVFLFVGLVVGPREAAPAGLFFGLLGGVLAGGMPVLRHLNLRITLWISGYAPLRYVRFLEHAAGLGFLRRVGGGYAFAHGMLREHFATAAPEALAAGEEEPSIAQEPSAAVEAEEVASSAPEAGDDAPSAADVTEEYEAPEDTAEEMVEPDDEAETEEDHDEPGRVNINTAPLEELTRIRHVGPTRAEQLIELRPFDTLDQLTRIDGIGPAALRDIREEGLAYVE